MKRFFLSLFVSLFFVCAHSSVRVQLFNDEKINKFELQVCTGTYSLWFGNIKVTQLNDSSQKITLAKSKDGMYAMLNQKLLGEFDSLIFVPDSLASIFIAPEKSASKHAYDDTLMITWKLNTIRVLNRVPLEKYVAAVMSAEIGSNTQSEFLKAKAIICRTYARASMKNHLPDTELLCNSVHCQVYWGSQKVGVAIRQAVKETEGKIMVDIKFKPVFAYFHSNCGGKTLNAQEAFSSALPYIRSVSDTFCTSKSNARWMEHISEAQWKAYLKKVAGDSLAKIVFRDTSMCQFAFSNNNRDAFYNYNGLKIPFKKIRADWKFRSSWFSISQENNILTLNGHGYGHGAGLCQEGAMRMAELGFTWEQILDKYYHNIFVFKE